LSQSRSTSNLAPAPRAARHRTRVAGGSGRPARVGSAGSGTLRLGAGRAVVARVSGRRSAPRHVARVYGHAWSVAPYGLVRTGRTRKGTPPPALCIYRGLGDRQDRLPGPQRPPSDGGRAGCPCVQRGRAHTTDRLITPFPFLWAQSGPRRVSPLNFSRGSGSIQRLLWLRGLLTCRSRGRA
jgi:hypothetical protein